MTVEQQDNEGDLVTSPEVDVSVSLEPQGGAVGDLTGSGTVTPVSTTNGSVTFADLVITSALGGTFRLRFTAPGRTEIESIDIVVNP